MPHSIELSYGSVDEIVTLATEPFRVTADSVSPLVTEDSRWHCIELDAVRSRYGRSTADDISISADDSAGHAERLERFETHVAYRPLAGSRSRRDRQRADDRDHRSDSWDGHLAGVDRCIANSVGGRRCGDPVHPAFVPIAEPSGVGWLSGFDELMCRCGLESNGAPDFDERGQLAFPASWSNRQSAGARAAIL